jgi:hypothetical protein
MDNQLQQKRLKNLKVYLVKKGIKVLSFSEFAERLETKNNKLFKKLYC